MVESSQYSIVLLIFISFTGFRIDQTSLFDVFLVSTHYCSLYTLIFLGSAGLEVLRPGMKGVAGLDSSGLERLRPGMKGAGGALGSG